MKQISKRAEAEKMEGILTLGGIWTSLEKGQITLAAKIDSSKMAREVTTVLSLAQAKALRTLLDLSIIEAERAENG